MLLVKSHQLKELNKEYSGFEEQKVMGIPGKFVFIVCGVWRLQYQPHPFIAWGRNVDHVCRQMKFHEKKKLKYVIMLCTALIFRTLRRINSVLNVQEKFKLSRKLSNDEVEGLYMWKCHCTMFHELLLLGKDMRSTASGFLFVMQIML